MFLGDDFLSFDKMRDTLILDHKTVKRNKTRLDKLTHTKIDHNCWRISGNSTDLIPSKTLSLESVIQSGEGVFRGMSLLIQFENINELLEFCAT